MEFLLADALNNNYDTIFTCGGVQSNHCRATAVAARQLGLDCYLLLRSSEQVSYTVCFLAMYKMNTFLHQSPFLMPLLFEPIHISRYNSRTGSTQTASLGRIHSDQLGSLGPLGSCYKLVVVVALHDALCFTDMDDLEEGKISTIFLNEFASFQENDSFSRLEYIFAYFFIAAFCHKAKKLR